MGGISILVLTQKLVTENVSEDPIFISSIGTAFTTMMKYHIKNLYCQNVEKDARIRDMEEQIKTVKIDGDNVKEVKANVEKVREELEESIIDMYADLHLFQQTTTTIIEQHSQVQYKNTQFITIREGIGDIDIWIVEKQDAPIELPFPPSIERQVEYNSLDRCQHVGKREYKETTNLLDICSQLHKETQCLIRKCRLPPLEELGKTLMMELLIKKTQQSASYK